MLSRAKDPNPAEPGLREELLGIRFSVEVRVADGKMTVRDLLDLQPGTILRSRTRPGTPVRLVSGPVQLATAEAQIEKGQIELRVESVDGHHG